jgi:hypothetical protein
MNLTASVVITCKGRLAQLQETLPRHFAQQTDKPYEIVVVDYGCQIGRAHV